MNLPNQLTAKVMGEIIAKGMSLSEVDLSKSVESEAVSALSRINEVLSVKKDRKQKLEEVEKIMREYRIE